MGKDNARPRFWKLSDLSDEEKLDAAGKCEEGELYSGDPWSPYKVFECPICSGYITVGEGCKHVSFIYDATNCEYSDLDEDLKEYLVAEFKKYCKRNKVQGEYEDDDSEEYVPQPMHGEDRKFFDSLTNNITIFEDTYNNGHGDAGGIYYGVCSEKFSKKLTKG